jgi:hypothetical protein
MTSKKTTETAYLLGMKPNSRTGFYHVHSASYECGMAYRGHDELWWPCSRLVNHEGPCGYEDNTAY